MPYFPHSLAFPIPFLPLVVRRECRNVLLVLMLSSFLNLIYTKSNVVTNPHKTHHLDGFRCFVKTCLTVDQRSLSGVEAKTLKRAEPGKRAGGRQRRARTTGGGGPSQWRTVSRLRSSALGGRELTGHLAGRSLGGGLWAICLWPTGKRVTRRRIKKWGRSHSQPIFLSFSGKPS